MADRYIDATYVDTHLSAGQRQGLFTDSGVYVTSAFNGLVEAATSVVQSDLRNSGYTAPTTTTDVYIKLATFGVFYELACGRPHKRLKLPQNWPDSIYVQARARILSGDAQLPTAPNTANAVGGWQASEHSQSVSTSDGSRPQVMSRKELQGY